MVKKTIGKNTLGDNNKMKRAIVTGKQIGRAHV